MGEGDEALAMTLWPHLLEAIAAGDHRMVLHSRSGRRVVVLAEDELLRLETQLKELMSAPRAQVGTNHLTAREAQILQLVASGLSGADIADQLGLSTHTIAQHLATARRKYGVRSSAAAVDAARRSGHLPAEAPQQGQ
ncbi:response regulator transcription factor [Kineococcus sp. SYSU DK005]|uniref:response regulator transcription factor n=1 Tax=Kineococcus sp. SYSU DK005 TaxID=3383126 RepID=UPI003D7C92DB